ncbi:MAG: methyltransferase, partial [bacterium]|nr:methyltransferase [bacterium]
MPSTTSRSIETCQISGSKNLHSIMFLGYVPPVNDMQPIGSRPVEQSMYPLELLYCPDSHLVQIGCEVDPNILFPPGYPYTSGTTRILRENFADLFEQCRKLFTI